MDVLDIICHAKIIFKFDPTHLLHVKRMGGDFFGRVLCVIPLFNFFFPFDVILNYIKLLGHVYVAIP
jgi:hypothetical protein